jgi:hypothetical protein
VIEVVWLIGCFLGLLQAGYWLAQYEAQPTSFGGAALIAVCTLQGLLFFTLARFERDRGRQYPSV